METTLKNIIRAFFLGAGGVVVLASVLIHPNGPIKTTTSRTPLFAGADIDPAVLGLFERSCQNCHSENTEWPWYSYIAPLSWLVEGDVSEARSHMNLSHWDDAYPAQKKQEILARIGAVVRSSEMPPARYTVIHTKAKLSSLEREQIYGWAHAERRRLKSTMPASVGGGS
jgi:hypothetical protein